MLADSAINNLFKLKKTIMKKVLFLFISMSLFSAASAQSIQTDINYSTGSHLGLNLYRISKNGLTLGIGASINTNQYYGETKGNYQELANVSLGSDGSRWSNAFRSNYQYDNFIENNASLSVLVGKTINKTSIYGSFGVTFRNEYWLGKGYDFMPAFTSPEKYFYVFNSAKPIPSLGMTLTHLLSKNIGFNVGYNTASKVSAGISFNFRNSKVFNY